MKKDNPLKTQLDKELQHIQFTKEKAVLERTHPTTWRQRFIHLWNKEITIPLLPISAVFILLFFGMGYKEIMMDLPMNYENTELIEFEGNTYYKHELERVIAQYED